MMPPVLFWFLQFFLLLFLTGFTSCDQWKLYSNATVPLRNNNAYSPQNISSDVLDCYSVQFYLATRQDTNGSTKACLKQNSPIFGGRLNTSKPTKILVHGWKNNKETYFTQGVTQAYLRAEDVNVIQVDWSKDAGTDYFTAVYRVPEVGRTLANFISRLVQESGLDVNNLHLIGFSLGAHVVGIAGYYTTPKVAQVIGLDPAGPLFNFVGPTRRISTESGKFVVTMHSCKYRLGTGLNLGHLNFNANNGMSQPGCSNSEDHDLLGFCSHGRTPHVFAASLMYPNGFRSIQCNDFFDFELGLCDKHPTTYFNGNNDNSLRGIYFFRTTSVYPFTTQNDTSELIPILKKGSRGTEFHKGREPPQLEQQQNNNIASALWKKKRLRNGQLKSAAIKSGTYPKNKKARDQIHKLWTKTIHHNMTDFRKLVEVKTKSAFQYVQ